MKKIVLDESQISELEKRNINFDGTPTTIEDLMEILPYGLCIDGIEAMHWYDPRLLIEKSHDEWAVHYGIAGQGRWEQDVELIDALYKMVIWVTDHNFVDKKYILQK